MPEWNAKIIFLLASDEKLTHPSLVVCIIRFQLYDLSQTFLGFLPQASHNSLLEFWPFPHDRAGVIKSSL